MRHRSALFDERMRAQYLTSAPLASAAEVVGSLCAVQSQDHEPAKWSLGMRTRGATNASIESAFVRGEFLRTHVLRPTWHFVTPADIRWLLALTAPHVLRQSAYQHRELELDVAVFQRAHRTITQALNGGRHLTRPALGEALAKVGIRASGQRLGYIMMHAELTALVCSGAMEGRQHTYALLDERVPATRAIDRAESLALIARRFFTGHSPSTVRHLEWWSGLTLRHAREGLEAAQRQLDRELRADGTEWWHARSIPKSRRSAPRAFLIPDYDEVQTGYHDLAVPDLASDTGAVHGAGAAADHRSNATAYTRSAFVDGARVGSWRRTVSASRVVVDLAVGPLPADQRKAVEEATGDLGRFLDRPVDLNWIRANRSTPSHLRSAPSRHR